MARLNFLTENFLPSVSSTKNVQLLSQPLYLSHDHSLSGLLHHIGQEQYAGAFEEIPAEASLKSARISKCFHSLGRRSRPVRRDAFTLVSSGHP